MNTYKNIYSCYSYLFEKEKQPFDFDLEIDDFIGSLFLFYVINFQRNCCVIEDVIVFV